MSWRHVGYAAAALLLAGASTLGVAAVLAPEEVERVVGEVKVAVQQTFTEVTGSTPVVRLEGRGGQRELDWCTGAFVELVSYRIDGVPPVYAAHNNCGGDVLLNWPIGQVIRIQGRPGLYEVVSERFTTKSAPVAQLRGLDGEFALQSCFYGRDRMRFVGLRLLVEDSEGPASAPRT